jgi:uncharacterized protein (DUF427 family)
MAHLLSLSGGAMSDRTGRTMQVEQGPKRVRAYLNGQVVADTYAPLLVWEVPYFPTYYIPMPDIKAELIPSGQSEHKAGLGEAEIYHVKTEAGTAEGAARKYGDSPVTELRDAVRLDWSAMSEWLEEDEPVYTHPRDPHTRIDILASSRHVRVEIDGVTVAESSQPRLLFETGLPTRYYLPLSAVRMDLLRPSDTSTHCPYKGTAAYWSLDTGTRVHKDVIWIYRTPLPESQKVAGLACFYNERVDIYLDGEHLPRPKSPLA